MLTLQDIVDALGRRLGVPVTLEDSRMRLLVHNAHPDEVDEARQRIILNRQAPEWAMSWGREIGLFDATEPIRVPTAPKGVDAQRVVVPIRWQEQLLGWIWVIEPEGGLDDEALAQASQAADHAAVILSRGRKAEQHRRQARTDALRGLLDEKADRRETAARQAVDDGLFKEAPVRVVVVDADSLPEQARPGVEDALQRVAELLPAGEAHAVIRGSSVVLLTAARDPVVQSASRFGGRIQAELERSGAKGIAVGLGSVQGALAAAYLSHRHAEMACRVAARVRGMGPIASWDDLGAYRALLSIPQPLDPALLHAGIARVAVEEPDDELFDTVEVYLDECGKAARAAAALHVHRGTLYYRLKRFSELTGCDLDDGADRLAAHLALKALRLVGNR